MHLCQTWSSSETLNGHHAAICSLGQLGGGAHLAGGPRLSHLHHGWIWTAAIRGAGRLWEVFTRTLGRPWVLHGNLKAWKPQIRR